MERLRNDFRNVHTFVRLAEIALLNSNHKKAKNYLIAAMALEPDNIQAKALWAKIQ
jgi:hypothetical protein